MKPLKRKLLIDLDGVLNEYRGAFNKDEIPQPKEGVHEFLEELFLNFELVLFTTRNRILASKWLLENNLDKYFSDITNIKELSWLIIDDRCINFDGDYKSIINKINSFQPWYKK